MAQMVDYEWRDLELNQRTRQFWLNDMAQGLTVLLSKNELFYLLNSCGWQSEFVVSASLSDDSLFHVKALNVPARSTS